MVTVEYRHWKKSDVVFTIVGRVITENGDRMVVRRDDGSFEDIIKDTIVEIR